MKHLSVFKSFGILLLSLSSSVGATSFIQSDATLQFESGSELNICKGNTLENNGTLIIKGAAKIGGEGYIKNESIIQLSDIDNNGTKNFIISGGTSDPKKGSIHVDLPQEDANQTLSGDENKKATITDLKIKDSSILTSSKINLNIINSSIDGEFVVLDGDTTFD